MFLLMLFIAFNSRKIFKAYYGFRVLYVFPFPSAGHGPTGSGRDTKISQTHNFHNSFENKYIICSNTN